MQLVPTFSFILGTLIVLSAEAPWTSSTLVTGWIFRPSICNREAWHGSSSPHRQARIEATETQAFNTDFTSVWKMAQNLNNSTHISSTYLSVYCHHNYGKENKNTNRNKYDFQQIRI